MKAFVFGVDAEINHEMLVKSYFLHSLSGWTCDIVTFRTGYDIGPISSEITHYVNSSVSAVNYAVQSGYNMIIRSYSGVDNNRLSWDYAMDNNVLVVHAHGSNLHEQLTNPRFLISAVTVGGGVSANERSYGDGLEFYSETYDGRTEESYTTPTVAAVAAEIWNNNPSYNAYDVKQHLRQIANGYASGWNPNDGFGKIVTYQSITGLELGTPLNVEASSAGLSSVYFSWKNFTTTRYAQTELFANSVSVYSGQSSSTTFSPTSNITYTLNLRSSDAVSGYSKDESFSIFTYSLSGSFIGTPVVDIFNSGILILGGGGITATTANTVYMNKMWISGLGDGIILRSPNGTRFKLYMTNAGSLTAILA